MRKKNNKLGIAIVGLGEYAYDELASALRQTKHCYLSAIVTDSPKKASGWEKDFKIPKENIYNYEDFDAIKFNASIDIVYIVLPNSMHKEYAIRTAKAGKHAICEKPMATTVKDCEAMIKAFKKSKTTLSIGYRLQFEPYNRKVMQIGQKKILGKIQKLTMRNGIKDIDGWRLDKKLAGGGALMDVGIYCIQAVRYTTGMEPVAVTAKESKKTDTKKFKDIEESISWQMEMPGGLIANCDCSYSEEMNLLHADTSKGWFELSPAFAYDNIKGEASTGKMNFQQINQQAAQLDATALAIKNNKPIICDGEMGKKDIKITEAVYKAMKSGKRIILN